MIQREFANGCGYQTSPDNRPHSHRIAPASEECQLEAVHLIPTTMLSGPTRCSDRVVLKPACCIHSLHSAAV